MGVVGTTGWRAVKLGLCAINQLSLRGLHFLLFFQNSFQFGKKQCTIDQADVKYTLSPAASTDIFIAFAKTITLQNFIK